MPKGRITGIEDILDFKKKVKALAILFILLFLTGSFGFMFIKGISFREGFVLTLETLAFLYEEEETGLSRALQIFLLIFGSFLIWFILWTTFDLTLEGHFKKYYFEVRNMNVIRKLKNHYIVCGAGRVGENIVNGLKKAGKKYVLVERDSDIAREMEKKGYLTLIGPSAEEATLIDAGIKKAKYLVTCTGDDAKNILIILTAKDLNPNVIIGARANDEKIVNKLKKAGAKIIVLPERLGAQGIIDELSRHK